VLDIDSPHTGRFTDEDRAGLEELARIIEGYIGEIVS
jgi:putative methionine-R-sulfoxide reductase with GAF domain